MTLYKANGEPVGPTHAKPKAVRGNTSFIQASNGQRVQPFMSFSSLGELRQMAALPKDAQEFIDSTIDEVGRDRLQLVQDLRSQGLTFPLPQWLGVQELVWHDRNIHGQALRTMTPKTREDRSVPDFKTRRIPVYATMEFFSFNIRELETSRRAGTPLDRDGIRSATLNVNEGVEDAAVNGADMVIEGNSCPGLLNAPNANTQAYETNTAWDDAGKTGDEIQIDVRAMAKKLRDEKFRGPYTLYVNNDYMDVLNKPWTDGTTTHERTVLQALEDMRYGNANLRVRELDLLPDDRTALVQMTTDVVDIVDGDTPTSVSWSLDPWNTMFAVIAAQIPRWKTNYNGESGVCLGDTT